MNFSPCVQVQFVKSVNMKLVLLALV